MRNKKFTKKQVEAYKKIKELAEDNSELWDGLMAWVRQVVLLRKQSESREHYTDYIRIKDEGLDDLGYFLFDIPKEIAEKYKEDDVLKGYNQDNI